MIDLAGQIVTAVASGAGGTIGAKGAEAINQLIAALRARLHHEPQSHGALEASLESPDDPAARELLASVLRDHISRDNGFAEWLAGRWAEVRPVLQVGASNSANVISGTVHGNVVQARDVQGGIHLGGA
jgi:hypothetical protein